MGKFIVHSVAMFVAGASLGALCIGNMERGVLFGLLAILLFAVWPIQK